MDDLNLNYQDDTRIELYLNDRMNESERSAFELAMMEDQALLQRVQLLEAFQQGLRSESGALLVREAPASLPFRAWIRQPLSLAASVLVAGLGIQLLSSDPSSPNVVPLRSVVVLEGTRGANTVAITSAGPYLFRIDAGLGTGMESYDLSLRNAATGALVMAQQDLQADANGWVQVALNENLRGEFSVELAWQDAQGNARTREYRVALNTD